MSRPKLLPAAFSLAVLLAAFVAFPAGGEGAADGIALTGSVKKSQLLDAASLAGLPRQRLHVKLSGPGGVYRATVEADAVALRELLDRAEVAKSMDDNFDRPLDLAVVVTGRDGTKAVFSWGELFLAGDSGAAVLADRLRPFMPHHHEPVADAVFASGAWLGPDARASLDVSSCTACHDGGKLSKIDVPRGTCLVPTRDATGRRFVEDVVSIEVRQAGFPAPPRKKDLKNPWVEAPRLVLPNGKSTPLSAKATRSLPRVAGEAEAIGLGRGYRGRSRFAGASLAALLRQALPAGTDPGLLFVVVTGSDGYRSLYSGGELLLSHLPENGVLVDTEGGKPLLRKSGRLKSVVRGDFFVDRSVRNVSEIRILTVP
ncbi:MAG TPA: hypothetical protein P5164_01335 [Thermoanaerobaculia bacterium]|nr:hypothetical protein [Thermoanaerobaculia bacterium]